MPAPTQTLILPDGRTIAWYEYGNPASTSPPVFYFHSYPSSRYEGALWHPLGLTHNLRIICPDRPGAGLSTHCPTRTLLSYPSDILFLANHLSIPQFRVLSVSGGGPYAFACLKTIPATQCLGGSIVSSIYPLKYGKKGMSFVNQTVLFMSYWAPGFLGWVMDWELGSAARNPDPNVLKAMMKRATARLPQRDQEALASTEFGNVMVDAARESFAKAGGEGVALESALLALDWGFELEDIDLEGRELTLWHGGLDVNCPIGMAEKAAALVKGVKTVFLDEEAHSLVAHHTDAIVKSLVPQSE
ncbi:alpha/beta-hydrolase [Stipitochalara longipes BDJ]|nr:alpha/beta-hydrolase [Stipitochalara longipes BDJ]